MRGGAAQKKLVFVHLEEGRRKGEDEDNMAASCLAASLLLIGLMACLYHGLQMLLETWA